MLIVIPRVADRNSSELCGERLALNASALEPKSLSWMGCPELLRSSGLKSRDEAILSFMTRAWLRRKAVMYYVLQGRSRLTEDVHSLGHAELNGGRSQ